MELLQIDKHFKILELLTENGINMFSVGKQLIKNERNLFFVRKRLISLLTDQLKYEIKFIKFSRHENYFK